MLKVEVLSSYTLIRKTTSQTHIQRQQICWICGISVPSLKQTDSSWALSPSLQCYSGANSHKRLCCIFNSWLRSALFRCWYDFSLVLFTSEMQGTGASFTRCLSIQHWHIHRFPGLTHSWQKSKYGWKKLRKTPGDFLRCFAPSACDKLEGEAGAELEGFSSSLVLSEGAEQRWKKRDQTPDVLAEGRMITWAWRLKIWPQATSSLLALRYNNRDYMQKDEWIVK